MENLFGDQMKTLRVTGETSIFVRPDLILFYLQASKVCEDYEEAVRKSAELTVKIKDLVEEAGFDRKKLKTDSLSVEPEYEYKEKEDGTRKRILVGYRYRHKSFIEFANDNKVLGKLIYEVSKSGLDVDFNVRYDLKDKVKYQEEALAKAVEQAKRKADIIAETSGVKLLDIRSINYSFDKVGLDMMVYDSMSMARSYNIDIDADEIEISEDIEITWNIE
ncbi:SIMPL domain-containing protein [Helcococcus massiliensis]|uniref:SIMPL domain-containing protein n=1 Tax=Helcococcus massiliensis TaxID=2040290 RepID=UPI000CDEE683|nr:SIMPL domain-containing protein [Helcococcus massiliensis]